MSDQGYWTKVLGGRVSRRRAIAATGATAAAAAFLAACGGGSSGGSSGSSTSGNNPPKQTGPLGQEATQGKRGGKLNWQGYGDPGGGLELVKIRNAGVHQMAGLTHDGLLEFVSGSPAFDGMSLASQPNLAAAMPEISPDKLTFTFKLRPAKFHNGRAMDSSDAKYSYDRYASGSDSAIKIDYPWLDKTETPDPQTFVIKAKYPYADAIASMSQRYFCEILCKEHEESPEHEKKLLGTGPYTFVSYEPPLSTKYKRNPEYHRQPFPYFDEVERLGTSDEEKKIADFTSKQTHVTYWFAPESRDCIKKQRPDALPWEYPAAGSNTLYMRTDKALTFGQASSTIGIGNYDAIYWGPNTTATNPTLGNDIKLKHFSPPEGIKAAPTLNLSCVNDQKLSDLVQKQLSVFDKNESIAVFRQIEDNLADNLYDIVSVSSTLCYFGDPSLKNAQMPREAYNGATPYMKYWWFDKA